MDNRHFLLQTEAKAAQIVRARVFFVRDDGAILVRYDGEKSHELACDILQTSEGPDFRLAPGDKVLVWLPENEQERGVVLGRIGPSRAAVSKEKEKPDEIVIEAKKNLTFKCGDGSITLRKDGKILIKGKDLVSRAKRMNRIKGGSVAIN